MKRNRFGCSGTTYQPTYTNMQQTSMCNGTMTTQNQMMINNGLGMVNNTTYQELTPIMTCSKNVVNQYHIVKQPYVHTYHTEVVHHHIKQAEYIMND